MFDVINSSFFCGGLTRAIRPNLCVSDLSVFVWFQHDHKETDGIYLSLRFVARAEKPIQGEFLSITSLTSPKNLGFLKSGLTRAIALYTIRFFFRSAFI